MISTAVLNCASENDVVADHVAALRPQSLSAFTARIERGMREGDIKAGTNARAGAIPGRYHPGNVGAGEGRRIA